MEYKGNPAPLLFMSYDECSTICVIAVDAEGNFGDMYMEVITLTEEGTCHDYALFDKYFNAVRSTSASAAAIRPQVKIPERPVPASDPFSPVSCGIDCIYNMVIRKSTSVKVKATSYFQRIYFGVRRGEKPPCKSGCYEICCTFALF